MKLNRNELFNEYKEPLGLYIHIPFCEKKCAYCDFYSEILSAEKLKNYLAALKNEIKLYGTELNCNKLKTIYFGGGTPSVLSSKQIQEIMQAINYYFCVEQGIEITIEANPASLTRAKLAAYNEVGINRLSLGVQSLQDEELSFLGRLHDAEEALKKIKLVKKYFTNYSLDLIFALPEQEFCQWVTTMDLVLQIKPPHLSLYNLQIEPGTSIARKVKQGDIVPLAEEIDARMYRWARKKLHAGGYKQYEISNFARADNFAAHNLIYWNYEPYLGLGPAAHSFTGKSRFSNPASLNDYLKKLDHNLFPRGKVNRLSDPERMSEMMFMGLRLLTGVNKNRFFDFFNKKIENIYGMEIRKLKKEGLLKEKEGYIKLTEKGMYLGNIVFREFI